MKRETKTRLAALAAVVAASMGVTGWITAPGSSAPESIPAAARTTLDQEQLHAATVTAAMLESLEIVPDLPSVAGYERDCGRDDGCSFGRAWTDDHTGPGGHDGCDTRNNVLSTQLRDVEYKPGTGDCKVVAGVLDDPYTGRPIDFTAGKETSADVQIDHVVPLARAWNLGAAQWPIQRRIDFANDQELNLLAADGSVNQSKSDKGLGEWTPPDSARQCWYAARYLEVSNKYQLAVTRADADAAAAVCAVEKTQS